MEPERYELQEEQPQPAERGRRGVWDVVGSGIVVVLMQPPPGAEESGGGTLWEGTFPLPPEVAAWLHVAEDGLVTAYTGKAEVGQDIRTSLAQAVADDLRLPFGAVRIVMGDTELTPFDMGTFGSRTTPFTAPALRKVAAAARRVLVDLAAAQWQVDAARLAVIEGSVQDPETGRSLVFGELARDRRLLRTVSGEIPTTPPGEWKVSGQPAPRLNHRALVTGAHRFASDFCLPGMLHGKVLRPPSYHAGLLSVDTRAAEGMEGVKVVHEGDFVGVVAPDEFIAEQAIAAIHAEWKTVPQPSEKELFEFLRTHPAEVQGWEGPVVHEVGSVSRGMTEADRRLQQTYTVAYIAHVPLETRASVAYWEDGKLTVWTGTQRPFGVRTELAQAFGLPEEQVRVIVPDTGSGYGGKHTGDAALEAARLARAARRPVKRVWTREEEFTWAYFRPAGVIDVASGVKQDGTVTAWEYRNINSGAAAMQTVYVFPNQRLEFHPAAAPLRQGSYRALAATANHFARETHLDELAELLGMDPLEFRFKNLTDPRLRDVLQACADVAGWRTRNERAPDRGMGIAGGFEKGSYVATVAEVEATSGGEWKVLRLVTAFDCGAVVNPENLKNQIEGAAVMGIGGALWEAIHFEDGRILNPRLSQYRVPCFGDVPEIEVVLIDRKDRPSAGAGETPLVCIAPAIGNALFAATGVRRQSLPLIP